MSRVRKGGLIAVLVVSFTGSAEGLRQNAYPDPGTHGKPWTICNGATKIDGHDVHPGDYRTLDQCRAMLLSDADVHADKMEACTNKAVLEAMPDKRYIAFLDFTFNLGPGHYCRSIAPLVNAGRVREACNALVDGVPRADGSRLMFDTVMGGRVTLPGLTSRRKRERAYCMEAA